jgi:hypothetical protein
MANGWVDLQSVWGFVVPMLHNCGGGVDLRYARRLGFQRIELHVDSMMMVHVLNSGVCGVAL